MSERRGDKLGGFGVGRRLSGALRAGGGSPGGWYHPLQKGTWASGALGTQHQVWGQPGS